MIARATTDELLGFSKLRKNGIPLDEEVLKKLRASSCSLTICQVGTVVENTVFPLDSGGSGYMLSILVQNDSSRVTCLSEFRLETLWHEPQFEWLEASSRVRPCEYSFPPPGPTGFDPAIVLNHRIGGKGKLNPGVVLDGFLFGKGEAPIPDQYTDRKKIVLRLSVFDARGNCSASEIELIVRREGQLRRPQAKERLCDERELVGKHPQSGVVRPRNDDYSVLTI